MNRMRTYALLAMLALVTLGIKVWLEYRAEKEEEAAQQAVEQPVSGSQFS